LLPIAAEERHPDQPGSALRIAYHRPVARLEDVERQRHARKENHVRQRENRNDVRKRHVVRPETPGRWGSGMKPLETEAPDARAGANAVDPCLHRRECRLELDAEASEHHDSGREGRVGERELLADEVLVPTEAVAQEVETATELLACLVDALHVPLRVRLA